MLYVPPDSSLFSTQFFVLISLLLFDIPLLYYYASLRSSIVFCLSSGDIYLSLGIFLSFSDIIVSELFDTFVILLAIFLPMKSPVPSAIFWIVFFEAV